MPPAPPTAAPPPNALPHRLQISDRGKSWNTEGRRPHSKPQWRKLPQQQTWWAGLSVTADHPAQPPPSAAPALPGGGFEPGVPHHETLASAPEARRSRPALRQREAALRSPSHPMAQAASLGPRAGHGPSAPSLRPHRHRPAAWSPLVGACSRARVHAGAGALRAPPLPPRRLPLPWQAVRAPARSCSAHPASAGLLWIARAVRVGMRSLRFPPPNEHLPPAFRHLHSPPRYSTACRHSPPALLPRAHPRSPSWYTPTPPSEDRNRRPAASLPRAPPCVVGRGSGP